MRNINASVQGTQDNCRTAQILHARQGVLGFEQSHQVGAELLERIVLGRSQWTLAPAQSAAAYFKWKADRRRPEGRRRRWPGGFGPLGCRHRRSKVDWVDHAQAKRSKGEWEQGVHAGCLPQARFC